jgi:hypothetical protein
MSHSNADHSVLLRKHDPFRHHAPTHNTPPSVFTDSSSEDYSSFQTSSSSRPEQHSRPSTSSGAILNMGMKQLMSSSPSPYPHPHLHPFFPSQYTQQQAPPPPPSWPVVIQLEEAPQDPYQLPRTDIDTFDVRMERIKSWRDRSTSSSSHYASTTTPYTSRRASFEEPPSKRTKASTQYRCTACDSSFASRQGLKRHAQGVRTHPACRTAVEYFLE